MITEFISLGKILLDFASKNTDDNEDLKTASTVLGKIGYASNVLSTKSVSQSAGRAIISPLCLFEESLMHQDYMTDLMTMVNMRDIRDTLTHINFQSQVGDIKIASLVDSINPNRSAGFMCYQGCEAYNPSGTSILNNKNKKDNKDKKDEDKEPPAPPTIAVESSEYKNLTEYVPLALGRTVNASISYDGKQFNFPLTFRQIPIPAPTANLKLMFKAVKGGAGWNERIKDYKSGGITRPELLTGIDDIRNEFKIRTRDMTGYYSESLKRERVNTVASVVSGNVSMNTLANTIIMSRDTADSIELEIGIRFGSSKMNQIRKYVRANTIVVVNDQRGVFEFYSCSSNIVEKYTLSQIKTKVKKEDTGSLDSLIKLLNGR